MTGRHLHAAQTFTTSSLICLGSRLIRSISLVWLSFTIFSSLVLYWYWSAMATSPGRPGDGESEPSWIKRLSSLLNPCITTVTLPLACQWTAAAGALVKMEAWPPPCTHTNRKCTNTHTQCNAHRQKRHALKENPGPCHISHGVAGLTGQGLHSGMNFHHTVRQRAQTHPPAPASVETVFCALILKSKKK